MNFYFRFCLLTLGLLLFSGLSHRASAQKLTQKRAEALYKQMAYKEAAALYEKVMKKNPGDGRSMRALGKCYVKLNDAANTEKWYSKIVVLADADAEDFLSYASALEMNGKSNEAREYFEKFKISANMDKRGERRLKSYEMRASFYADSSFFQLLPFGNNSRGDDFTPQYYKDGLIFSSNGVLSAPPKPSSPWTETPFYDLYYCRYAGDNDSMYLPAEPLSKHINTKYHESAASLNKEQNQLAFTRSAFNGKKEIRGKNKVNYQQIFLATDKSHDWKNIKPFLWNSTEHSVCHPAFSSDGNTMYFASDMQGGLGGMDLYVSRYDNGRWTEPVNLGIQVNTEGNELFPYVVKDSLLYFSSNGRPGIGGLDVYVGEISGDQLKNIVCLSYPVNTRNDDFALIYDIQKRTGYFTSNRPGGLGGDDIYRFRNTRPPYRLRIAAFDESGKEPLKKVKLKVTDEKNNLLRELLTDSTGIAYLNVIKGEKYVLTASLNKYFDQNQVVETNSMNGFEMPVELPMYKDLGFKLVGQVKDGAGLKGIGNVKVTIVEKETGKPVFSGMTNEKGEFFKSVSNFSLNQTMNLTIKLEKEGYLTRELTFNQKLERSGDIDINKKEDLLMDELKVGVDIGKIVDLNPIYFDSGKWNIRTDAAVELDKIVKAMNDNPSLSIEVGSHTDSKGQAKANLTLSDKRAKSTADYIISKGISASRISGKGYGESQLVNKCKDGVKCSDSEHQQNRRTEFKVVKL